MEPRLRYRASGRGVTSWTRAAGALLVASAFVVAGALVMEGVTLAQGAPPQTAPADASTDAHANARRATGRVARGDAGVGADGSPAVGSRRDAGSVGAGDASSIPAAGPDAAVLDPDSIEARRVSAGTAFAEGLNAFRRGDYAGAAQHFEAAYQFLPDPAPLFNMARAFEGANDVPRAIESYERYLVSSPSAADRNAVLDRLARLRARPAQIFLVTEPPGAAVYLDEQTSPNPSSTPLVLSVPPGDHTVVLEREGYRRTARRFAARPGVTDTVTVGLIADATNSAQSQRPRADPRILNRRSATLLTPRFTLFAGAARAFGDQPLSFSYGTEVWLFVGRSFVPRIHYERIEPDGIWNIVTADFGYVVPLEDIDLGVFAVLGAAFGPLNRALPHEISAVPAAGFEFRLDWQFHQLLSVGIFFRPVWRNFFIAPPEFLNSLGGSLSLSL